MRVPAQKGFAGKRLPASEAAGAYFMAKQQNKRGKKEVPAAMPEPGKEVVVQCEGFRCLAYRDEEGGWKSSSDHEQLEGVVKVLFF